MLWWFFDDMKLTYIQLNPWIFVGFIWLLAALFVQYFLKSNIASIIMVAIPGVPLAIMAVFMLVIMCVSLFSGPIRWN